MPAGSCHSLRKVDVGQALLRLLVLALWALPCTLVAVAKVIESAADGDTAVVPAADICCRCVTCSHTDRWVTGCTWGTILPLICKESPSHCLFPTATHKAKVCHAT